MSEQDGASTRKKIVNKTTWKKTIRKYCRNKGLSYVNTKNKEVSEKSEPSEDSCKCQFSCTCLTLECRKKLFHDFWNLGDYNEQQIYLKNLIRLCFINRRRLGNYEDATESRRQRTFKYYLIIRGMSEVQTWWKKAKTRPQWREKIIVYIKSIPAQESHYSRNDAPNRKYLPTELSVVKLYKGFLEKHRDGSTKPPVSRQWFNEIFLTEFNFSFKPPRVDTCPTCDSSKIEIDTAPTEVVKDLAKQKLDFHHKQAVMARKLMNNDGADSKCPNSDVRVVQFDLQQQMYLPTLTHTQMYYSRQLAFVNMGIHLEDEGKGIMFL
ncbi:unnamed protein product [Parnassius apollo]|uniref:(apollo) hypothetical protein n=1 Tax=Parnassius apollo TaxID=110799 RepID=A0A8S3WRZ4_PARAO|nr:unnamed protein product [Parnassius apollo]